MALEAIPSVIHIGVDVGSTTTKLLVLDPSSREVLYSRYKRHNAHQAESLKEALAEVAERFGECAWRVALCGSGGESLAKATGIPFVQEVVANAQAVAALHPSARCAIELGGQDAKMVFFREDERTGQLAVSDMRMNGSCAGGTGAFIDEIAALLKIPVEEYNELACQGSATYDVSGRCGVYAKTDIQPLLNQGVPKADIALSAFHAVAKQTIGGLAQGLDINPPVVFEGGPLTFNPRLIQVFAERLELTPEDVIVPEHPETIVAYGAALSLETLFADEPGFESGNKALACVNSLHEGMATGPVAEPLFADPSERERFEVRHRLGLASHEPKKVRTHRDPGQPLKVYLGIDSGSTTTKFALIDEDGLLVDSFYASNEGEPLAILKQALLDMHAKYVAAGTELEIAGVGTTGYGELLFSQALHADHHTVETVVHAHAATSYVPDATFILDIGGQDMKAIWLDDGIITDIVVNEACSSGCGSFLESFASNLGIKVQDIADSAFRSKNPAVLGSRCTVFMNSSIVSEQRNGKTPDDIMAGLCRSIIENVFTKVIRVSNLDSLGKRIVVQGGTFQNDAVLRALEQYIGREVVRAPYPGLMGAIGEALLVKEQMENRPDGNKRSSFIGFEALENLTYTQETNLRCPFCSNHCNRTRTVFSDGTTWMTGHRCSRGEIVGDPHDDAIREQVRAALKNDQKVPNLYEVRERLLLKERPVEPLCDDRGITIGIPRVLAYWDRLPFWRALFESLGFKVVISGASTRKIYEQGLSAVTSDTVCFPAKLVHGHVRDLVRRKVDRIWYPILTTIPSENAMSTSESMCAVVKGYPIVMQNSDNTEREFDVPMLSPLFHWYTYVDRDRQLGEYLHKEFGIERTVALDAIRQGDAALDSFRSELEAWGESVLEDVKKKGRYAVVLAGRPYHNDPLVNHDLPHFFTELGIPVLTADSVPGRNEVDLSNLLIDVVNNFHARMLSSAVISARSENLEYVQIVSFGCGHDAYLSDEIIRISKEISGKTPLVLKVDESDIQGPLRIRVRSFIESVNARRGLPSTSEIESGIAPKNPCSGCGAGCAALELHELEDPYPQKFTKSDLKDKTLLVPNTSHAFSMLMAAAFARDGLKTQALPVGREEAIRLGKKYVHNDICFPCQIVIGEALAALESGEYDPDKVAICQGKYIGDCRLTHYAALTRKALDDAGYPQVPIVTNDDVDFHNLHPGYKMSLPAAIRIAFTLPVIDVMEELLRKIRPYELEKGSAQKAFDQGLDLIMDGLSKHGIRGMRRGFKQALKLMLEVEYDRSNPRPTVLIVGEYLLNFHPGANHDIELYLEENGLEVIEARMTDVIRKSYFYKDRQVKEYKLDKPFDYKATFAIEDKFFDLAHNACDRIAKDHPLYKPAKRMDELVKASDPIIHHTFDAGEGVLIPGEILHHAEEGCRAFVILQPFGCLPNHVVGRGIAKRLKEMYPDAQILPLDYDPDVSFANIENRLQMLIMNARAAAGADSSPKESE